MVPQSFRYIGAVCLLVVALFLATSVLVASAPVIAYAQGPDYDSDGDGVGDDIDLCPNTPSGTPVNSFGCPIGSGGSDDSDGDGVPDDRDVCSNTPSGTPVDDAGCPIGSIDDSSGGEDEKYEGNPSSCSDEILNSLVSLGLQYLTGKFGFGASVPTSRIVDELKETRDDCIAWATSGAAIEQITGEVIREVNSGFNGNPAYVTSIGRELQRSADNTFLSFIGSGSLSGLPRYFQNDILFALIEDYNRRNNAQTRLTSTLDEDLYDPEAFVNGDFSQGGWGMWFKLTQYPQNNPYGAFLLAQEAVNEVIVSQANEKQTEIETGQGYLSKRVCEEIEVGTDIDYIYEFDEELGKSVIVDSIEKPLTEQRCKIVTPGSTIKDALTNVLGNNVDRIVQIDELNEGFSSLSRGLTTEILSGDEGLFGSGAFIEESSDFTDILPDIGEIGDFGRSLACDPSENQQKASKTLSFNTLENDEWEVPAGGPGNKQYKLGANGHYGSATIEYDFFLNEFDGISPIQGISELRNVASDADGAFVELLGDNNRAVLNMVDVGFTPDKGVKWENQIWYHVRFNYEATPNDQEATVEVSKGQGGSDDVVAFVKAVPVTSIFTNGGGLNFILAGEFTPDGVYRLEGSKFSNIEITLEPGEPFCTAGGIGEDTEFDIPIF